MWQPNKNYQMMTQTCSSEAKSVQKLPGLPISSKPGVKPWRHNCEVDAHQHTHTHIKHWPVNFQLPIQLLRCFLFTWSSNWSREEKSNPCFSLTVTSCSNQWIRTCVKNGSYWIDQVNLSLGSNTMRRNEKVRWLDCSCKYADKNTITDGEVAPQRTQKL